ncbi:MAG: xanthine dehydrogenase family protein molybdopterin-binding subunit [Betaproteobacteria bacterium]|nr:xanthine dehydrogenase family protein molybdopterin-binding subunit [Betaproteobacteria bacterium]
MSSLQRFGSSHETLRSEDRPLITGRGRFTDDVSLPGQVYGAFVRASVGHAILRGIDTSAALNHPGVLAVLTGKDAEEAGMGGVHPAPAPKGRNGSTMASVPFTAFPGERIVHVGQSLALVVAETEDAAQDAAELVVVDFEELPAAPTVAAARAPGAPQIYPHAPGNVSYDWEDGDAAACERAFAAAHYVERVELLDTRVAPCTMEPRAALAVWDEARSHHTLTVCSQGVGVMKKGLAEQVFKVAPEQIRVLTYDVGGGFGMKTQVYPEYPALMLAAKTVKRPVKWCASRLESFLSDTHGRDGILEAEMAFDESGRITALRSKVWYGIGAASVGVVAAFTTQNTKNCLSSVYAIPQIHVHVQVMFTNAAPLGPYRGAGRPEAIYMVERLLDEAAPKLKLDRVEIRRRNMVPPSAMPYAAANGQKYDSGEFEAILDKALKASDWSSFAARRRASEAAGKLRGIGIGCFLEVAGGMLDETAEIRFSEDGFVDLYVGAQPMGQGPHSTYPPVVAAHLGVDVSRVRLHTGDSDLIPTMGMPSVASRSMMMAGSALYVACDEAIRRGKHLAEQVLEVGAADIEFGAGEFRVPGTDVKISLLALAAAARKLPNLPPELAGGLDNRSKFVSPSMTFPNGCHICEVEVDPETGVVRVVAYTAVDDVGNIMHETIVTGQIHGGVAQGLGQVLGEEIVYDESGQLLTASFMDYPLPRAADMPPMTVLHHAVPATTNPLGVKGAGESGVAGAIPSAVNAICDALGTRGVRRLDLPFSPARVWHALQQAAGA